MTSPLADQASKGFLTIPIRAYKCTWLHTGYDCKLFRQKQNPTNIPWSGFHENLAATHHWFWQWKKLKLVRSLLLFHETLYIYILFTEPVDRPRSLLVPNWRAALQIIEAWLNDQTVGFNQSLNWSNIFYYRTFKQCTGTEYPGYSLQINWL